MTTLEQHARETLFKIMSKGDGTPERAEAIILSALVEATERERERCARVADRRAAVGGKGFFQDGYCTAAEFIATAIRAGETEEKEMG